MAARDVRRETAETRNAENEVQKTKNEESTNVIFIYS
jgi:hypothetical protein